MDVVVKGHRHSVPESFRAHVQEKVSKIEQLSPRAQAVEVQLKHENSQSPELEERVEITVFGKGQVLRAEASASDKHAALDLAWAKLLERLRRAKDRSKVARSGHRRPASTAEALAGMDVVDPLVPAEDSDAEAAPTAEDAPETAPDRTGGRIPSEGDSPVVLREKSFPATPIAIDEALNRMEMVGHDFYLFIDAETKKPSVVYRRRGWSYGVIALDDSLAEAPAAS